jgi:hypothetical protein
VAVEQLGHSRLLHASEPGEVTDRDRSVCAQQRLEPAERRRVGEDLSVFSQA